MAYHMQSNRPKSFRIKNMNPINIAIVKTFEWGCMQYLSPPSVFAPEVYDEHAMLAFEWLKIQTRPYVEK